MVTLHALVMVFGMIMPAFAGFANWMIPMMIGAPDMALPRLNNWSFWLLPFARSSCWHRHYSCPAVRPHQAGQCIHRWCLQTGDAFPFLIFSVHLLGISSIMAAINIIVTILNLRTPSMSLMQMPLFVWAWLITAYLLIAVMPVLAGGVTMLLMDQFFGTSFFQAAGGGDPVLFQHIFWFFGHPRSTSSSCRHSASSRRSSRRSHASRCSAMTRWSTRRPVLRSCHLSSGHITCSRSACHWPVKCSSCWRRC